MCEKYYTILQISKLITKSPRVIQDYCKNGKYKSAIQLGGKKIWYVLQEEIDLLIPTNNTNINKHTILNKEWV